MEKKNASGEAGLLQLGGRLNQLAARTKMLEQPAAMQDRRMNAGGNSGVNSGVNAGVNSGVNGTGGAINPLFFEGTSSLEVRAAWVHKSWVKGQ